MLDGDESLNCSYRKETRRISMILYEIMILGIFLLETTNFLGLALKVYIVILIELRSTMLGN